MKTFLRNFTSLNFIMALFTFGILVYYKVCLCSKAKGPLKIFLLFNSLTVSDFAIISPRYQKTGKMSTAAAFMMRVSQKFINIIIAKMLLLR